jgi:hypothetical protein
MIAPDRTGMQRSWQDASPKAFAAFGVPTWLRYPNEPFTNSKCNMRDSSIYVSQEESPKPQEDIIEILVG